MKNFIEVNTTNKQIIINLNHIVKIKQTNDDCFIIVTELGSNGRNESIRVIESYDQIKLLIEQASK